MTETEVGTDISALKDDLAKVKDDLASLAGAVMSKGRESARAVGEAVKDKVNASLETLGSRVEERPLTMLMIAFAAGALSMLLLRRK